MNIVATSTFSTAVAVLNSLPRIAAPEGQRQGEVLTVDPGGLTGITAYQWRNNGVDVSGAIGPSIIAPMMGLMSCVVTGSQGTAETPTLKIYHAHDDASHNSMDDAMLALIPQTDATHIAITDGVWSDTATWDAGTVPGAGSVPLIPQGRTVTYDVASSPRLDRLRIEGLLNFSITQDTELLVETITVPQGGELRVGTSTARLPLQFDCVIKYSDRAYRIDPNSPTDLDWANDPQLLSRGLLWHGKVSIWAAQITPWVRTENGSAPMAGDTSLTLEFVPAGWNVGDTIVIGSTFMHVVGGVPADQNEERVVANIVGDTITWTAPLLYDHDHQNPIINRTDLQPAVFNKRRNVKFFTEAPHEDAVWRRAHTMAMHGTAIVDIWGVSLTDMGRTDKSKPAGVFRGSGAGQTYVEFDPAQSTSALITVPATTHGAQSNLQSRYPIHMHFCGFGRGAEKPIIQSCYVENAPAWAYVHHGCEADFFDNVGYRFVGAGMVSETGDELGAWVGNLIVGTRQGFTGTKASSGNPKVTEGTQARFGDFGFTGMGMFFRGRAMRVNNNMVMSAPSAYVFFHRANGENPNTQLSFKRKVPRDHFDLKSLSYLEYHEKDGKGYMDPVDAPIRHFAGNECAGVQGYGFAVTKSASRQHHMMPINIKHNKFWAVRGVGVHLEYVGLYNFLDNQLFASEDTYTLGRTRTAFILATLEISNFRNHIEGFEIGLDLWGISNFAWTKDYDDVANTNGHNPLFIVGEANFVNVQVPYKESPSLAESEGALWGLDYQITALQSTRIFSAPLTEVIPSLSGPEIAYTWTGGTDLGAVLFRDYRNGVHFVTDTVGTKTLMRAHDDSGLYKARTDHNIETFRDPPQTGPISNRVEKNDQYNSATGAALRDLALRDGYWKYQKADTTIINALTFPLYIGDRTTGRPAIYWVIIECQGSMANYTLNPGTLVKSTTRPFQNDMVISTPKNTPVVIPLLAGATGEAGATLALMDEVVKPDYGELTKVGTGFNNGDGTATYTPDRDHVTKPGQDDSFYFHVYDGRLNAHTGRVTITVTEN